MCYRCRICSAVSPPREPLLRYTIYRTIPARCIAVRSYRGPHETVKVTPVPSRKEIAGEIPVCPECYDTLALGVPLRQLIRQRGVAIPVPIPTSAEQPPPLPRYGHVSYSGRRISIIDPPPEEVRIPASPPARPAKGAGNSRRRKRCEFCRTGIGSACSCV